MDSGVVLVPHHEVIGRFETVQFFVKPVIALDTGLCSIGTGVNRGQPRLITDLSTVAFELELVCRLENIEPRHGNTAGQDLSLPKTPEQAEPRTAAHRARQRGQEYLLTEKETDNPNEIPTITEVITLLREFGEGLIAAGQEPSKPAESLLSNTATKVMLPTTSYTQFSMIADSIGLKQEQRDWAHQNLETGNTIIYNRKTGLSPVEIPLYTTEAGGELSRDITDEEVEATVKNHLTTST